MNIVTSLDIEFCRSLLANAHECVKLYFPEINLRKDAWVYHCIHDHWEFHECEWIVPGTMED